MRPRDFSRARRVLATWVDDDSIDRALEITKGATNDGIHAIFRKEGSIFMCRGLATPLRGHEVLAAHDDDCREDLRWKFSRWALIGGIHTTFCWEKSIIILSSRGLRGWTVEAARSLQGSSRPCNSCRRLFWIFHLEITKYTWNTCHLLIGRVCRDMSGPRNPFERSSSPCNRIDEGLKIYAANL